MNLRFFLITFLILIVCISGAIGQKTEVEFKLKNFAKRKKEFDKAILDLKEGDAFFDEGMKGNYSLCFKSIPFYLSAWEFNPNSVKLAHNIAVSYYLNKKPHQAIPYFIEVEKYQNLNYNDDILYLADCFQLTAQWGSAVEYYQKYQDLTGFKESASTPMGFKEITKSIKECNNGRLMSLNPVNAYIRYLGKPVNEGFGEDYPLVSADGQELYFSAYKGTLSAEDSSTIFTGADIFKTKRVNGQWSNPKKMMISPYENIDEKPVYISPDGLRAIIFINVNGGDLYETEFREEGWTTPIPMSNQINSEFRESYGSYSFDYKEFWFVSSRPGGMGGSDIWIVKKKEDGNWGTPVNAGPNINTEYDEDGIFLHPDGKMLYFSSRGHNTCGGFDLFEAVLQKNGISKPENLGFPINSAYDEKYITLTSNGLKGYITTFRPGNKEESGIFEVTFKGAEKQPLIENEQKLLVYQDYFKREVITEEDKCQNCSELYLIKGTLKSHEKIKILESAIEVVDLENNTIVYTTFSDVQNSTFTLNLPSGKNYGIFIKSPGFLPHSENIIVPATAKFKEIQLPVSLYPIREGEGEILNTVAFEHLKKDLKKMALPELDRLNKFLTQNPKLRIEFSCYTDESNDPEINLKLSDDRAKVLMDRLSKYGIENRRLYRSDLDIDEFMCSPEDRQTNKFHSVVRYKIVSR